MRTSIAKRFKLTKGKKILHARGRQDHFNAKDSGKIVRRKRKDKHLSKSLRKTVKRFL